MLQSNILLSRTMDPGYLLLWNETLWDEVEVIKVMEHNSNYFITFNTNFT